MQEIVKKFQLGDYNYVKEVLESNLISPNLCDGNNYSLLHWVAINNYLSIASLLLHYNANPNIQCFKREETPLHW